MSISSTSTPDADLLLRDVLHRVWGFSDFRPLQREAMHAVLERRDSVVVLPTGGGKSLCFQAPALVDASERHGASARSVVRQWSGDGTVQDPPASARRGFALVVSPL